MLNSPIAQAQFCEAGLNSKCLYATPSGTGDGSFARPGSISTLVTQLSKGDYLYLRGGEYTKHYRVYGQNAIINLEKYANSANPQPTADEPVTVKNYPNETALIKGNLSSTCIFIDGISNLKIVGLKISNCLNESIRIGKDVPRPLH